jgi:hypothetical protein
VDISQWLTLVKGNESFITGNKVSSTVGLPGVMIRIAFPGNKILHASLTPPGLPNGGHSEVAVRFGQTGRISTFLPHRHGAIIHVVLILKSVPDGSDRLMAGARELLRRLAGISERTPPVPTVSDEEAEDSAMTAAKMDRGPRGRDTGDGDEEPAPKRHRQREGTSATPEPNGHSHFFFFDEGRSRAAATFYSEKQTK